MGRWKLVGPRRGESWELYDLETDGPETENLAPKDPQRVADMASQWEAWAERCGVQE